MPQSFEMSTLKRKTQKKRAVKTRPFGREASILAEKRAKCVILKENGAPLLGLQQQNQAKAASKLRV
jgi:hypothetical protein